MNKWLAAIAVLCISANASAQYEHDCEEARGIVSQTLFTYPLLGDGAMDLALFSTHERIDIAHIANSTEAFLFQFIYLADLEPSRIEADRAEEIASNFYEVCLAGNTYSLDGFSDVD